MVVVMVVVVVVMMSPVAVTLFLRLDWHGIMIRKFHGRLHIVRYSAYTQYFVACLHASFLKLKPIDSPFAVGSFLHPATCACCLSRRIFKRAEIDRRSNTARRGECVWLMRGSLTDIGSCDLPPGKADLDSCVPSVHLRSAGWTTPWTSIV
ncbi:uncharacterized protein K489DRAFT_148138 [Dissoconium aciculare CBS 342.82]|uniref:Uncharacterized protein n=1 Tax=Dissoconium aciculare CBS 342.82 TaxID=1314786 RepID=A0A6J3MAM0_9PEZI|nr:uncharacterized protein K489DRAFT_148138 [Dissoconium aciculare CBS 342.82]KAF1825065.1 hypothetical protein K489DRAFT_148138 [Dissoconium aciculare CBS 342.82]